ncbi:MAG: hypothetical protein OEV49_07625 [candidate division Zixibacteria bacterium]|nr:hypothetical protein [candidate division Zixibacteria bacterium]MDH3938210.1 hypothetical protein [candidate division Zixibacteria bacterium]MDH4034765.1 hypothetical protein [candidate division Zixibacteria bacterium]
MKKQQCKQIKIDGKRCRGRAVTGSKFCFFHDPKRAKQRQAAQRKGGINRLRPDKVTVLPSNTLDAVLRTADDVCQLLSDTINQVRKGVLDVKIANSVGYLAGVILKARSQGELEDRIVEIEEHIAKERTGHGR